MDIWVQLHICMRGQGWKDALYDTKSYSIKPLGP